MHVISAEALLKQSNQAHLQAAGTHAEIWQCAYDTVLSD